MVSNDMCTFLPRRPSDRASFFVINDSVLPLSQRVLAEVLDGEVVSTVSHKVWTGSAAG